MRPLSPIVMHSKLCYVDGSPLRVFRSEMTEVPPDWLVGGWLQEIFRSKSIYWLIFQEISACLICKCRATSVISSLPALSVWHQNWWNSLAIGGNFSIPDFLKTVSSKVMKFGTQTRICTNNYRTKFQYSTSNSFWINWHLPGPKTLEITFRSLKN